MEITQSTENTEVVQEERPEWLDTKFASVKQMSEAYAAGTQEEVIATEDQKDITQEIVEEVPTVPGVNTTAIAEQYATDGVVSEDNYKSLEAVGISKDMVDTYIEGQKALSERANNELLKDVGGQAGFDEMSKWAALNVRASEIEALNKAFLSPDKMIQSMALNSLYSKYKGARGKEARLVQGNSSTKSEATYESRAQLVAAMSDPRYKKDSAFRASVESAINRSNIF